jgi:hypothetical protein
MKNVLLFFCCLPFVLTGQIVQTNIETIDEIEQSFKRWGGKEENILIQLLEETNIDSGEKNRKITIEIKSSQREINFSSLGFGNIGAFETSNIGIDLTTNEYEAFFIINPTYYAQIKDFLNKTLFKHNAPAKNSFTYNLNLDNRFNISLVYDKNSTTRKYKYVLRLDEAWFTITFDEGLSLLRKLIEFQDKAK